MSDVQEVITPSTWKTVGRDHPCEICGTVSNYCSYREDGTVIICRSTCGEGGVQRTDKTGALYWLHRRGGMATGEGRVSSATEHEPTEPKFQYERADADTLHRVYDTLLSKLTLDIGHSQELHSRGYTTSEIQQVGFKSWPDRLRAKEVLNELVQEFGDTLLTVPGFSLNQETKRPKMPSYSDGYLLPIRDAERRIIGLQVRLFDGPHKYLPFSARSILSCGGGLLVHVTEVDAAGDYVLVTEGFHKGELAARKLGVPAIALPSVTAMALALPALEASGKKIVMLALDADARKKQGVGAALIHGANLYAERGYEVRLATWTLDAGKGIDDVIHAGKLDEVKYLGGKEAWATIVDLARAAKVEILAKVTARMALIGVAERAANDRSVALRTEVINALATLDETSIEYLSLMDAIGANRVRTELNNKVKAERKKRTKQARLDSIVARGGHVFAVGDHKDIADKVRSDLSTQYDYFDQERKTRVLVTIAPVFAEGAYWRYQGQHGIWTKVEPEEVDRAAQKYSGASIANGKTIAIQGSTLTGVQKNLLALCTIKVSFR